MKQISIIHIYCVLVKYRDIGIQRHIAHKIKPIQFQYVLTASVFMFLAPPCGPEEHLNDPLILSINSKFKQFQIYTGLPPNGKLQK